MEERKHADAVNQHAAPLARVREDLTAAHAAVQNLTALLLRQEQEIAALRSAAINAGTEFIRRSKTGFLEAADAVKAVHLVTISESVALVPALELYAGACDTLLSWLDAPHMAVDLEPPAQYESFKHDAQLVGLTFAALSEQAHTAVARNEAVAEGLRSALVAFATR